MAKVVEEAIWKTEGAQKRAAVRRMFSDIASSYDRANSMMSLRLHHRWRRTAVAMLRLQPGETGIDVCSGTGDFLPELRDAVGPGGHVLGIDFCPEMLAQAVNKYREPVMIGDANQLPLRANVADGVSVGWGIRNVPDIDRAHAEIFRILKSGGRFVSLDMAVPQNPVVRRFSNLTCDLFFTRVISIFGNRDAYTYLRKSTERFMSRENLVASMQKAGFVEVRTRDLFFGNICIHFGMKP